MKPFSLGSKVYGTGSTCDIGKIDNKRKIETYELHRKEKGKMMASAFPSGKVREIEGDAENGEGKRTKNGQDLVKKRLRTIDGGRFWITKRL